MQTYEYAGFLFVVITKADGSVELRAAAGQHAAAYSDKHRRAATQCYREDRA